MCCLLRRRPPAHCTETLELTVSVIFIKCPATGRAVSTGIEIDRDTFSVLPDVGVETKCPACGGKHIWRKGDAWLSDDGEGYRGQPQQ
jgi:predicted RNA-binding Zn-ribbon protein involved in translation (DUF1610 family)